MSLSKPFVVVAAVGVVEAFYHASNEHAFVTNYSAVSYSPYASLFGIPYWAFGIVWFPLIFLVGLGSTGWTKRSLSGKMLVLLTVGNMFTAYLWYLDIVVVNAFTAVYVALYATNYVLTALVVAENRSRDGMRGFTYGTITGAIVGLVLGPYGVAVFGIGGGIFGALQPIVFPARTKAGTPAPP